MPGSVLGAAYTVLGSRAGPVPAFMELGLRGGEGCSSRGTDHREKSHGLSLQTKPVFLRHESASQNVVPGLAASTLPGSL